LKSPKIIRLKTNNLKPFKKNKKSWGIKGILESTHTKLWMLSGFSIRKNYSYFFILNRVFAQKNSVVPPHRSSR
jgi:hypothetical protein